jgi:cytidylate kinase
MQNEQITLSHLLYSGNVCISGLTASGKTTHSHLLAGEFGLTYVSGSQIQLNFRGLSPIQDKDFWISEGAKELASEADFRKIDDELLRIEQRSVGCIFDTSLMPWRHKEPALCIWLESDLESRIMKSAISHRGRGRFSVAEYKRRILEKDRATISINKKLLGIEIGMDLDRFDLVLDISECIREISLEASLKSITKVHELIRPAAAWWLTRRDEFRSQLVVALSLHADIVRQNNLRI